MANKSYLTVSSLIQKFGFDILYRGNLNNHIQIPSLNRTGIELASNKIVYDNIISAVLWSGNENRFISKLQKDRDRVNAFKKVLKLFPPVIILTSAFKHRNLLLEIAKKYKTTILTSNLKSSELYIEVAGWINEQLAVYKTIHGTLVNVFGVGVLIEGKSGVGKSETALELVKKGHMFVADDAVDITNISGKILAKPNPVAGRFIEIRGLGILNVSQMFGIEKTAPFSNIDVIIEMVKEEGSEVDFERLGSKNKTKILEKVKIPYYCLPITPGRKMSDLIEAAVIDFKLKQHGYNSAKDYISNFNKVRKNNKNN